MNFWDWAKTILAVAVAFSALFGPVFWAFFKQKMAVEISAALALAKQEITKDVNGLSERIDDKFKINTGRIDAFNNLYVALDDRLGVVEADSILMKERQSQQWERVTESLERTSDTMDSVTVRLEDLTKQLHSISLENARQSRVQKETQ